VEPEFVIIIRSFKNQNVMKIGMIELKISRHIRYPSCLAIVFSLSVTAFAQNNASIIKPETMGMKK
jgi:hypothetical protein